MKQFLMLISLVFLSACGGNDNSQSEEASNESATKQHMLSDQEKMIQKAKETEEKIKQADEKRRQAIKDQGG